MYKVITIGGKDYKLEYSIEASLYEDCISQLMQFFADSVGVAGIGEAAKNLEPKDQADMLMQALKNSLVNMGSIPSVATTIFYAGLMKYQGTGKYGNRTILSRTDAAYLLEEYFEEHKEDDTGNFWDILNICMNQMAEDGFFKLTGLEKMINQIGKQEQDGEQEETPTMNREQRRKAAKASKK